MHSIFIIGAGFTGLGAGLTSGFKIFKQVINPVILVYIYIKCGYKFIHNIKYIYFGAIYK